jgi:ferrochelatase
MAKILLVNFGGPREISEVESFLRTLLCDRDVVRTRFPTFFHNWFFRRIARKRTKKVSEDYEGIGGRSPIYFDTEALAAALSERVQRKVHTFHRYLPATHAESLKQLNGEEEIKVLPLFPQFCYATTGSIARFLSPHFPNQLRWIKSYAAHPAFIRAYQRRISDYLSEKNLREEETILLFSAHGVPKIFVEEGDPYEEECRLSYEGVMRGFPRALGKLSYQSKFGRGEWIRPYTDETCEQILTWHRGRKNVVVVPISFTSDHIETLFEIEKLYLPLIAAKGIHAYRCPALNLAPYWIDALVEILQESSLFDNRMLIR